MRNYDLHLFIERSKINQKGDDIMLDLAWYWYAAIVAAVAGLYYWFYVR